MRYWIVSEFYDPYTKNPIGYYVRGIAERLAVNNNVILVLPLRKQLLDESNENGVVVNCVHPYSYNRGRLISRLWGHIIMSLQYFIFLLIRVKRNDTIMCFTQPVFFTLLCPIIKKLKGVRTVVVVHDLFPESLIGSGATKPNWLYRFCLKLFNKSFSSFNTIISIGDDMTQLLQNKIPNNQSNIVTIPNWADIDKVFFQEKSNNEIVLKYNLESKIVFTYAGNIGRAQGIENLLRLIECVEFTNQVHFLFIGRGVAIEPFLKRVYLNKYFITYAGFFPETDNNLFFNACDIAIISLLEGMTGVSVPSKTYNILASGHPILFVGATNSDVAKLVKKHDIGWVCNPSDSEIFSKIVKEILSDPRSVKMKGEKARRLVEKEFSKEMILNRYTDILENIK